MHAVNGSPITGNHDMAKSDKKATRGRPKSAAVKRNLNVRFPSHLHDALAELAAACDRTLTAELVVAVREHLQRHGKLPSPPGRSA